jgi:hypothetical protein|tara:strand:+ start:10349 stop:11062 length:714 start_codon:yes stop_codon:yes gene_type:complete
MPRKKADVRVATKRDSSGLITQPKVDYVFNEDGTVDWRKMVKPEFLVPNKQKTDETDVSKLEDHQLIILLGGIKELAQIRGYTNVQYSVTSPSSDYVVTTCSIDWIPNYETEDRAVTFSAIGDASPNNTQSFAKFFLGPIAENRSFVRCVRNFLKINIVAQEELGNSKLFEEPVDAGQTDPKHLLERVMKEKHVSFEQVKTRLVGEKFSGAEDFESIGDIPKSKVFELIQRIKNKVA